MLFSRQFCIRSSQLKTHFCYIVSIRHSSSTTMSADLHSMRKPYYTPSNVLHERDFQGRCPFELFQEWFEKARESSNSYTEVNGVCLATASKTGQPSARMVLLKSFSKSSGFQVFTNYQSRKGQEIAENPQVALLFHWDSLNRQIRVEGRVEKVPVQESEQYFHERPRSSQISARASQQSMPVENRDVLVKRQEEDTKRFEDQVVPKPDYWGGYSIIPHRFEFWQGQSDRLHDRFQFDKTPAGWSVMRLQP